MRILGIDPDKKGACVLLVRNANGIEWQETFHTPILKSREYNLHQMSEYLKNRLTLHKPTVFLEQNTLAAPGRKAIASTAYGFGVWEGMLAAHGYAYHVVAPKTWQKKVFSGAIKGGTPKERRACLKAGIRKVCQQLFPGVDVRSWSEGACDAAMIAVYGFSYQGVTK